MKLDEVYQAAIQAGSGGIRWNSITKFVQLADENKNWIDWKYYNPNYAMRLVCTDVNGIMKYEFVESGLYLVCGSAFSGIRTMTLQTDAASEFLYKGDYGYLNAITATAGNSLYISQSISYNGSGHLFYIGRNMTVSLNGEAASAGNVSGSKSFTNASNRIIIANAGGQTRQCTFSCDKKIITDNQSYALCACIGEEGSASASVTSPSNAGNNMIIADLIVNMI